MQVDNKLTQQPFQRMEAANGCGNRIFLVRWPSLSIGLLFFQIIVSACQSPNNAKTVIKFWAMGAEGEHVQKLLPEFNRRHPDIEVKIQGIPWYVDTRLLFYRKDILAKAGYDHPPRTWEEWFEVSKKIKQLPGATEKYALLLPTNEWTPFVLAGLQTGSLLLKQDNRYGDFSGAQFSTAFSFLMKFYRAKLAPVGITQVTNIYQGISEGFFAMYITGPWNIGEFQRRLPANLQNQWMTAPMPGPDANTPGVSLADGSSLVMFKDSQKKAEAWKLIEYLSEAPQQLAFYKITGDLRRFAKLGATRHLPITCTFKPFISSSNTSCRRR